MEKGKGSSSSRKKSPKSKAAKQRIGKHNGFDPTDPIDIDKINLEGLHDKKTLMSLLGKSTVYKILPLSDQKLIKEMFDANGPL